VHRQRRPDRDAGIYRGGIHTILDEVVGTMRETGKEKDDTGTGHDTSTGLSECNDIEPLKIYEIEPIAKKCPYCACNMSIFALKQKISGDITFYDRCDCGVSKTRSKEAS